VAQYVLEAVLKGGIMEKDPCATCGGAGAIRCSHCGGNGINRNSGLLDDQCHGCKGTGKETCQDCEGTGVWRPVAITADSRK
jgi:DnaJ-class molecular chaperone